MTDSNDLPVEINEVTDQEEFQNPIQSQPDTIQLLSRLILGMITLGSEGFDNVLIRAQEKMQQEPGSSFADLDLSDEDELDQLRYLLYGSISNTQKRVKRGVKRGLRFSLRMSGAVIGTFYAITDNRALRPARRPVDQAMSSIARQADKVVRTGRVEENQSRVLAQEVIDEMTEQIANYIAENPKMRSAIQEIIGGQGIGMAQMMMDGINNRTSNADNNIEGAIRRVLRMTPREDLPDSPIAGKPQFMYLPDDYVPGEDIE